MGGRDFCPIPIADFLKRPWGDSPGLFLLDHGTALTGAHPQMTDWPFVDGLQLGKRLNRRVPLPHSEEGETLNDL
jgi:hypothetical protein